MRSRKHIATPALRRAGGAAGILAFALATSPLALAQPSKPSDAPVPGRPPLEIKLDSTPIDRTAPAPASFAPIVDRAKDSVVQIFTSKKVSMGRGPNMLNDPMFRFFFGEDGRLYGAPSRRGGAPTDEPAESQEVPAGVGSGVIISTDGYILTNNHVVADMDGIKVRLANGSEAEYEASVVGADPGTDIALLKVDAKDLPAVVLGDSTQISVGDRVFAIGNPFNVGVTVTSGIVSGLNRSDVDITLYENFIQTDAPINQGNSGGALVDIKGRLIGVNSAILSKSGGSQGVGLAVPVNLAWSVVNSLSTGGKPTRGYLGVAIEPVSPDVAELYGLPGDRGTLVTDVVDDAPAFKAGLRAGDVITHVNDIGVNGPRHLTNLIGQRSPGTETTLRINRSGKEVELKVQLADREQASMAQFSGQQVPPALEAPEPAGNSEKAGPLGGLQLADYDPEQARSITGMKLPPASLKSGAIITQVSPESPAFDKGIKANDIIVEINRQPVTNAEEARKAATEAKESKALVRFWSAAEGKYDYVVLG